MMFLFISSRYMDLDYEVQQLHLLFKLTWRYGAAALAYQAGEDSTKQQVSNIDKK